jgi:shikimate kinase
VLRSLALVGMPGSGKSTAGKLLGRRLGAVFVDADVRIEAHIGDRIRTFFEREGEEAFRDIEAKVIAELVTRPGCVLATGGGAVLRESNREALRRHCDVVYLRCTPEELYRRLRNDTQRPLLQVVDPLARLREMHAQRDPLYRETAHFIVENLRPTVQAQVSMVLSQLERAGVVTLRP